MTTIFVTHDQREALSLSDRIAVMDSGRLAQCGTPFDIYNKPATTFVADFVGSCSLLKGTVVRRGGSDGTAVRFGEAGVVTIPESDDYQDEERVSVVFRPEWLALADGSSASNTLRVSVTGSEFAGDRFVHFGECDGQAIRFDSSGDVGANVVLRSNTQKLVVFRGAAAVT